MAPRDLSSSNNWEDPAVSSSSSSVSSSSSAASEGNTLVATRGNDNNDNKVKRGANEVDAETMMQPSLAKHVSCTYHWELNIYCALAIAILYYYCPGGGSSANYSEEEEESQAQPRSILSWIGTAVVAFVVCDAGRYYYFRGSMAGVPYTLPLVNLLAMLVNPQRFWAELGTIAMASADGMCANIMVCSPMVFITNPTVCKQVFTGEGDFQIYAHPNALWLFDPKNLIYLPKEAHKQVRAILTPALFSETALQQYAIAQERVVREALEKHAAECAQQVPPQPFDAMVAFRSLGAQSSQEAFLGPYLTSEMRESLEQDILVFTMGFLSFPFPYLGGLRRAIQAKERIEALVRDTIIPQARHYTLTEKQEPRCLLEHWCQAIAQHAEERGLAVTAVPDCSDDDIARCLLDFLFAAQDATNSALTYGLDVLHAFPDVLQKCHEEVVQQCGVDGMLNMHKNKLEYCSIVANQLLHYKPPVPMVPHLVKRNLTLGGYYMPKGTVVIPSITYSSRVSGQAKHFRPDPSLSSSSSNGVAATTTDLDTQFLKTFTFGAGQHKCPGRRYAESLLRVFVSVVAQQYMIERNGPRPGPDDFIFYPTLFPKDPNFVLKRRTTTTTPQPLTQ